MSNEFDVGFDERSDRARIVAFGEILWDMLPTGKKLGGAPVNFLYHAHTLGALAYPLTRIGVDELGNEIEERLQTLEMPDALLQHDPDAPTGVVAVTLDEKGAPSYEIVENVAWDYIEVDDYVLDVCKTLLATRPERSAFYFGSLALRGERNRAALQRLTQALPSSVARVCDLNLRAPFYSREIVEYALTTADVFKLNDEEALVLERLISDAEPILTPFADSSQGLVETLRSERRESLERALERWASQWRERYRLQTIILTCGSFGAYLLNATGLFFAPSVPTTVKDSVGAGDSFAALCIVGLLDRVAPETILRAAAERAAFVCRHDGATPDVPEDLRRPFDRL